MAINVKDKLVTLESLGVAYSTEQDAREEADQALSTRIDNIVAPEGDPSLTEVSDARVSGSTTHNTLKARLDADKAAIETEISGINESLDDVKADLANKSDTADMLKAFPTDTASGAVASFADGANCIPVKSLVVGIKPVQAGSGDPSPTNVRPISGWTGVEVTVSPTTDAEDGDTYDITFPSEAGTVYGGTLDVTNGVLTSDMACIDLGTLSYYAVTGGGVRAFRNKLGAKPVAEELQRGCTSIYAFANARTIAAMPDKTWMTDAQGWLYIRDDTYSNAASFAAAMSGVQFAYELVTPQTYQLTPTEVTTLLGANNIWADTGDCAVVYRADTKLYIYKAYEEYRQNDLADYADALAALG